MECLRFPELSYGEFSKILHRQRNGQRSLLSAGLELTERCNLRCAHCYINRAAGDREAKNRELSFREWARLLEEMAAEGCLWLLMSGGEPLLRPDFREIYLYAKRLGMIVTLFTNGTLLTPELADFLQEWPPFEVEISVYGRTEATYEAVTRSPGSYGRCLRGIDLLLARKIPLTLKSVVMTLNAHELWDLKAWAEGLGVRFRYDTEVNARLDGGKKPHSRRLSPEEVVEFDRRDEARLKDWQRVISQYGAPVEPDRLYTCAAGISSFHVDPYGQMYICLMSRWQSFDLTQGSLREGWQEFIPRLLREKRRVDTPCMHCALITLCGQCSGWSELEHGDLETPVDYLCRIAHLRAQAIGLLP